MIPSYKHIQSMGTRLELLIPDCSEEEFSIVFSKVETFLEDLEELFSNFSIDSEIFFMNNTKPGRNVSISDEVKELMEAGVAYKKLTKGYFDFTLGRWTLDRDTDLEELSRFRSQESDATFRIKNNVFEKMDARLKFDVSGIAKGYAMRGIEKMLREDGISSAFISFGGSSVCGIGNHPYGEGWKLGIQDPMNPEEVIETVILKDETASISGNSLNNSKRYGEEGHVLNPMKGTFIKGAELIAVVAPDALDAEVLSTALMSCGGDERGEILKNFDGARLVDLPGITIE